MKSMGKEGVYQGNIGCLHHRHAIPDPDTDPIPCHLPRLCLVAQASALYTLLVITCCALLLCLTALLLYSILTYPFGRPRQRPTLVTTLALGER